MIRAFVTIAVAFATALTSCASDAATEVSLSPGRRFDPPSLTVPSGATVTWVSRTDDAHSVTASQASLSDEADYFSSGGFASEEEARANLADALIQPNGDFSVTFDEAGRYEYFCIPHEADGMRGVIIVE